MIQKSDIPIIIFQFIANLNVLFCLISQETVVQEWENTNEPDLNQYYSCLHSATKDVLLNQINK